LQNSSLEFSQKAPSGFIVFGKMSGAFGIKGDAKIFLHNRDSELLGQWLTLFLFDGNKIGDPLEVKLRGAGKKVVGEIKGMTCPEDLDPLFGLELLLKENDLPDLEDDDEFYHHDLLGLEARTEDGQVLGTIEEITPGTVAIFTVSDGETEHFIPFISERVLEVKEKEYVVVVPLNNED
jgi:16S rRNA processing protein RimM